MQGRMEATEKQSHVSGKRLAETSSGHNPLQTLTLKIVTKAKGHLSVDKKGLVR